LIHQTISSYFLIAQWIYLLLQMHAVYLQPAAL